MHCPTSPLTETPMPQAITALVVENDEMRRTLVITLLEESEMNVIQCESAEAAVDVLDQSGGRLSVIFTDVELAGIMDGIELAHIARQRFPDLHIIVTSGTPRIRRLPDGTTFMAKPWSWCCGGSCSSATSAVANASVTTHSSWPVIPFLGISPPQRLVSPVNGPASREISADSEMKASKTVHPTRDARKLRKPGRAGSAPRLEAEDARPSTIRADL